MNGFDEENLTSKKVRNNGAKGQTLLLRRCIQSIEGLTKKTNPNDLIKEEYVTKMTSYDRDYLFFCIRVLGGVSNVEFLIECDRCGEEQTEEISFSDLEVYDWPEEEALEIPFELPRGIYEDGQYYKKGKWKFLTGKQQEQISKLSEDKIVNASLRLCVDMEEIGSPSELQLKSLSTNERNSLLQQVSKEAPGVQTTINVCCDACGHESEKAIDVSRFFKSAAVTKPTQSGNVTRRRRRRV